MLPKEPLQSEEDYREWADLMQGALEYALLWDIVSGAELCPDPSVDPDGAAIWKRKDSSARTLIRRTLSKTVAGAVAGQTTSFGFWTTLRQQYARTSATSTTGWFRLISSTLSSVHKLDDHIRSFQEAHAHLSASGIHLPEQIAAGLFLSSLVDQDGEPTQWSAFTAKFALTTTTTLNEVIAEVRVERTRVLGPKASSSSSDTALLSMETAYAALEQDHRARGLKWCRHCAKGGHWSSECRRSTGQQPKKNRGARPKKKERANVAKDDDDDEDDGGSADEHSHFVQSEYILYTSLDNYDASAPSLPTCQQERAFPINVRAPGAIVIDSGTSSHVHSVRGDFAHIRKTKSNIHGFGNGMTTVTGRGEAQLIACLPGRACTRLRLKDACYAPKTSPSLVSVSRLDAANCYTLFGQGRCVTFERADGGALLRSTLADKNVVLTGTLGSDRLYHLDVPTDVSHLAAEHPHARIEAIHKNLAHLSYPVLIDMIRRGRLAGIKLTKAELASPPPPCTSCIKGKMTRASFPPSQNTRPDRMLACVSTDLWGKGQVETPSGKRYMMTFTDHWSRWLWVVFLRHKSDAFAAFKEWLAMVERETGEKLATLRADNGGEYLSNEFQAYCKTNGIRLETTSARTPEQNGVAERQNRSVFERVRVVLIESGLPIYLWAEAACYVVYTKNRNASATLGGLSPFQVRFGRPPDASFLHRFGCRAFVYNDHPARQKLDPRAHEGVFVGYAPTQKAYRIYFPTTRRLVTSIHVKFNDDINGMSPVSTEGETHYDSLFELDDDDSSRKSDIPTPNIPHTPVHNHPPPDPDQPALDTPPAPRPRGRPKGSKNKKGGEATRRSTRILAQQAAAAPGAPVEAELVPAPAVEDPVVLGPGGGAPHPAQVEDAPDEGDSLGSELTDLSDDSDSSLLLDHSFVITGDEPKTYKEAMASPDAHEWEAAMRRELESIASLDSFKLTELPQGRKSIGTKWVFLVKRDPDGNILRYKARLVAQGFTQQPGIDFKETFAPVAKPESIRAICAFIAQCGGVAQVVDVDSAFLNSEIPEDQEAYVKQPPGFAQRGQETLVWHLRKALYGLKQSGHLWYQKLKSILVELGFKICRSDPCVFYRFHAEDFSFVTSHVDDLGLFCSRQRAVDALKIEIARHVPIKDLGDISVLLGVKVTRDLSAKTISFSHAHKIRAALEEFGFKDVKPASSPMVLGQRLTKAQAPTSQEDIEFMRGVPFMSAVGTLMHIAIHTRPDIAKAVQSVAQFMANPGKAHWNAVKRIFQYLKATQEYVLTVGGDGPVAPIAYCNADWGNDPDSPRSTSGYGIFMGCGVISWSAKKQTVISLSTGEAEYYAGVHCGREVIWLRQLLVELRLLPSPRPPPTVLRIDSTSAIRMINNPDEVSNRTKHVNVAYHWIRESVRKREMETEFVPGEDNIADIFTKPLPPPRHQRLTALLGIGPATANASR